jgi:hypothetical protein
LTLVFLSCQTSPAPVAPEPLKIDWPVFPDPTGRVSMDGDRVVMDADYWLAVARYAIDVDACIGLVEASR